MAVTGYTLFGPRSFIYLFILIILEHESCSHAAHDTHKLQTVEIHDTARHNLNNARLESDQPIHVPSLHVLSLLPSAWPQCSVTIPGRHTPHLATSTTCTTRYASMQLFFTAAHIDTEMTCNRQNCKIASTKPFKR